MKTYCLYFRKGYGTSSDNNAQFTAYLLEMAQQTENSICCADLSLKIIVKYIELQIKGEKKL